ncbi:TetR/AcrR family transcriptional regulator [Roseomonas terrae]|jgi:AcrR family transcriptional regulator|uniref:TetR/AcrR family transcriptional regulator n=1 Tax=Neoroseomonas terrae TaxID=424799 RepID=A0ABS5EB59_9PROT|nr:TetR/AcrR family transcriptional regulator [Neoroseomonas terrae]MBR0648259.1 TetR/AcrR family transcriptional regulator [Neoroseomonas terrae]
MSIATEAPPRRRLGEADRLRLLREAAEDVFLRDGYAAARMDDVAALAGMSKRTLYQHFPSKAELFGAVMKDCFGPVAIDPALESEPELAAALCGMLVALTHHIFEPRQVAILRLVIGEVKRSPELADAFNRAVLDKGANALERRLAAEVAKGRLSLTDPVEGAHMLFGMAIGAAHMFLLLGLQGPPTEAEMHRLTRDAVDVFLRGALRSADG